MAIKNIHDFIRNTGTSTLIDVRSPAEFENGHIPGAYNIPLFNNEERARVGLTYKEDGKETAVKQGLEIVGPKMRLIIETLENLNPGKQLKLYCWRGGMRSSSMAWLFETAGYDCQVLEGGYKSYRGLMTEIFKDLEIILVGGETGSGKTEVLYELRSIGEQVLDLEGLANHRGSAFGSIGMPAQPTSEQFQNLVIREFLNLDPHKRIFLEDESTHIGKVSIPETLWSKMKVSPLICLAIPLDARIQRLVAEYGQHKKADLEVCIRKIERKLGGQNMNAAIQELNTGDLSSVAMRMLYYYDKSYRLLMDRKKANFIATIRPGNQDSKFVAKEIVSVIQESEIYGRD